MEDLLLKILSFLLAIGILVTVHEFGHFWVARKLGIKVLRFSIGFGKPLLSWRGKTDNTEYVVAAIPLGGYVKMLDEREGDVDPDEVGRAFNRQLLWVRSAVVFAGPLFNFIFAILAFWAVFVLGETGMRPLLGEIASGSAAEQAQLRSGEEIVAINGVDTPTWGLVLQELAGASVSSDPIGITVKSPQGSELERELAAGSIGDIAESKDLLGELGITPERPLYPAVFGELIPDEAAAQAGVESGDRILHADGESFTDWPAWVKYVQARPEQSINLQVERAGQAVDILLVPAALERNGKVIGRIGATNQPVEGITERYRVEYSLPAVAALTASVSRTFEYSWLTLKVVWRILTGQASVHNLSGPLTIADVAGKTASYGLVHFLKFLAVVSISLGVLNLLPIPVLDGGHLLYFAIEAVRGSPVPEEWMIQGQKIGLLLLAGLMTLAFYVDFLRFLG